MKTTKPAISYQRFSDLSQSEGDSFRRQDKMRDDWLERHPEYALDDTLRDPGVSAYRGKNAAKGQLSAFLEACKAGRVRKGTLLIIESHDRLTRMPLDDARQLWEGILRQGVDILNLKSGRISTKKDLNDPTAATIAVWEMYAAHEYSKQLSKRLSSVWEGRRGKLGSGQLIGNRPPTWLEAVDGKWKQIPDRVKAVRMIFKLASSGKGLTAIVKQLNDAAVPTFGKSSAWGTSTVYKILKSRSVLGEMQPRTKTEDGERVPVGDPIQNYYPAIVKQATWDKVHAGLSTRSQHRGPKGKNVANLFTGIAWHAVDGGKLNLRSRGPKHKTHIVSAARKKTTNGSKAGEFQVAPLENAILHFLTELTAADINGNGHTDAEDQIEVLEGKLVQIEKNIARTKKRLEDADDDTFDALLDTRQTLETKRRHIDEQLDDLRQQVVTAASVDLEATQAIVERLKTTTGDKLIELREQLKHRIAQLVSEIWILPVDEEDRQGRRERVAFVQIFLRSGGVRAMKVYRGERIEREYEDVAARGHGVGSPGVTRDLPAFCDLRNYRDKRKGKDLRANPVLCLFGRDALGMATGTMPTDAQILQMAKKAARKT